MADDAALKATLSPAVPQPPHVPDSLVYDFDHFYDPGLLADPHGRVLDLLAKAPPIFWTPRQGGTWILIGHEANFDASRDWESFSSEYIPRQMVEAMLAMMPKDAPRIPQPIPINVDPPMHGVYRAPINAPFSPKAMLVLKDSIRALAADLIDRVAKDGRCEFMSAIAEPMPVTVFLKLMGLPLERTEEYRDLVKRMLANISASAEQSVNSLREIADAMRDTMLERRDHPQDDLISRLWAIEIEGRAMTLEDMENYGVLLFIAGLDTVMNGMGFGARHLAQDLALQDRLRADPSLIPEATEELLRRYTFTVPTRRVAKDVVFQGVEMKSGDRIMLFLPAADLDSRHFPHPETFDLARDNKVHIAFNSGPHRCLGSHLARVELQILYEELLARLPQFRLDPERAPTFHGGQVIGVDSLHLVWNQ